MFAAQIFKNQKLVWGINAGNMNYQIIIEHSSNIRVIFKVIGLVLQHINLPNHLMPNQVKKREMERSVMLEFISRETDPLA